MVIVKHRAVTPGQKIDAMESKSDGEGGVHAKQLQKETGQETVSTWEASLFRTDSYHLGTLLQWGSPTNTHQCLVFKHTHGQFGSQVPQLCCILPR